MVYYWQVRHKNCEYSLYLSSVLLIGANPDLRGNISTRILLKTINPLLTLKRLPSLDYTNQLGLSIVRPLPFPLTRHS